MYIPNNEKEENLLFSPQSFLLVPGTGLEPALLSEHAPETCASTNSAIRASGSQSKLAIGFSFWCFLVPRTRLELARLNRHYPLKVACLPISPPGLVISYLSKSSAKVQQFSIPTKFFFNFFLYLLNYRQIFFHLPCSLHLQNMPNIPKIIKNRPLYYRFFLLFLSRIITNDVHE